LQKSIIDEPFLKSYFDLEFGKISLNSGSAENRVVPDEADHLALREIVRPPVWILLVARDSIEAHQILRERAVDVVICDRGCWKGLLSEMWAAQFDLIVADGLAE
jgi:hypothetical protein